MKLLLHTCCAPCLIYPLEQLGNKGFEVEGLFYNPNIHPFSEYKNRKQAVIDFNDKVSKINIVYSQYLPEEYFHTVNLHESGPGRCSFCQSLRLRKTARLAKEKGFEAFSTTLLVSPYQNQELIRKMGEVIAADEGVGFYYEDFRPGFKKAHDLAKSIGIYRQKYCGCIYSEIEKTSRKK